MIDVLADRIGNLGPQVVGKPLEIKPMKEGSPLPYFDEAERIAVNKSDSIFYRDRHDRMTNADKDICKKLEIKRGNDQNCRYDALVKNYDRNGRDLLIEAKPDPDKGSIRIAIGQLFDYRRFLPHRAGTDLAVLTILEPEQGYQELLLDLQISALWFHDESCHTIGGAGKAWAPLEATLRI
jgi:hypothetical protein